MFRRFKFADKLRAIIMIASTVALIITGTAYIPLNRVIHARDMRIELITLAGIIAQNCHAALMFDIRDDASQVLGTLESRPDVRFAAIYDNDGQIFAQKLNGASAPNTLEEKFGSDIFVLEKKTLWVQQAVMVQDQFLGTVVLGQDMSGLRALVLREAAVFIIVILLAFVIVYFMTSQLARMIAAPITSLANAARRATEEGDYSTRVKGDSQDEVGELIDAFNRMLDEIGHRRKQWRSARDRAVTRATEAETARKQLETATTKRIKAEAQERELLGKLERAERLESLGLLAGGVAHDLNNILGPMVALPEMIRSDLNRLKEGPQSPSLVQIQQDLETIEYSASRAAEVIRDLMTMGRPASVTRLPLNVKRLVDTCLSEPNLSALLADKPELTIDASGVDPDAWILGSESHLVRCLYNLISNAIDATDASGYIGHIDITCTRKRVSAAIVGHELIEPNVYVALKISDSGRGIAADDLARVFEPFYSQKNVTPKSGSGLGLAIVHGIIKDHGGYLDVESVLDEGTQFTLYFSPEEPSSQVQTPLSESKGGNEHILIADDEAVQRHLLHRSLTRLGYTTEIAANGKDAVKLYEDAQAAGRLFDLVMLDMVMDEGFDGLDAYTAIKATAPDVRCIIVSGFSTTERSRAATEAGAVWLSKPYFGQQLAAAVRSTLDTQVGESAQTQA
ncbi:MAG: signal transduction histidine kinase/ActR/RegA family two-component response regulator [Candidatus Promineifilaceae bacterium]|jgi:signal transduction histidine kinase/ActR/RegA family two-component response regulator